MSKLLWCAVLPLPLTPALHAAARCAATPNAAVLQALGDENDSELQGNGFRVRDIVTDPLLHRAFVQLEQCGHPERPLVSLPIHAEHTAKTIATPASASVPLRTAEPTVPSGTRVAVVMGDAHTRMTVEGRLLVSTSVGGIVEVQLTALGNEALGDPAKRVRGRLAATDRVEVQP